MQCGTITRSAEGHTDNTRERERERESAQAKDNSTVFYYFLSFIF